MRRGASAGAPIAMEVFVFLLLLLRAFSAGVSGGAGCTCGCWPAVLLVGEQVARWVDGRAAAVLPAVREPSPPEAVLLVGHALFPPVVERLVVVPPAVHEPCPPVAVPLVVEQPAAHGPCRLAVVPPAVREPFPPVAVLPAVEQPAVRGPCRLAVAAACCCASLCSGLVRLFRCRRCCDLLLGSLLFTSLVRLLFRCRLLLGFRLLLGSLLFTSLVGLLLLCGRWPIGVNWLILSAGAVATGAAACLFGGVRHRLGSRLVRWRIRHRQIGGFVPRNDWRLGVSRLPGTTQYWLVYGRACF